MIRPVLKTPELLIKLSRIIGHDVADLDNAGTRHFVKHDNATDPDRQRARNVRLWGPSSVARTLRYLRMRKLGSKGSVLKLQLFIQDGEGWDNVKGTCREGLSRLIDGSLNGVRRYDRRVGFDDYAIESIRDHQYDALKRHSPNGTTAQPTSVETTSLVIGMLCNGRTLNGSSSRRLAVPILKALIPRAPDNFVELCVLLLDVLIPLIAPTKDRLLAALDRASPEDVERGRQAFLTQLHIVRCAVRRLQKSTGIHGKTNPLTLFGIMSTVPPKELAKNPLRMTPAHIFGAFVGLTVAIEILCSEAVKRFPFLAPILDLETV